MTRHKRSFVNPIAHGVPTSPYWPGKIEVRGCDLFVFSGDKIKNKDPFWTIVE